MRARFACSRDAQEHRGENAAPHAALELDGGARSRAVNRMRFGTSAGWTRDSEVSCGGFDTKVVKIFASTRCAVRVEQEKPCKCTR